MKVKFVPQNVEFEIKSTDSVMNVAHEHGIYVKSVCKGVPNCAECRVRVIEGDHNVMPPSTEELSLIGTGYFIDRRRLSCQLKCFGDITVDMTEQLAKQSGLIGGRKSKKLQVKDDRVEEAVARRAEGPEGESDGSENRSEIEGESSSPAPREARAPRTERGPRDQQARPSREPRSPQPPREPRGPQAGGARAQGEPRAAHQHPQGPRPPQQGGGPEGDVPRKRRRRRGGKGRGSGGGAPGGGPSGGRGPGGPSGGGSSGGSGPSS